MNRTEQNETYEQNLTGIESDFFLPRHKHLQLTFTLAPTKKVEDSGGTGESILFIHFNMEKSLIHIKIIFIHSHEFIIY